MTKKKRKKSVLSRQKPRKIPKKSLWRRLQKQTLLAASLIFAGAALGIFWFDEELRYGVWEGDSPFAFWDSTRLRDKGARIPWDIQLNLQGHQSLDRDLADDIIALAKESLHDGSKRNLSQVAKMIQQQGSLARVHLVRVGPKKIIIRITQRHAVACIEADRRRYVTSDADIYGHPSQDACRSVPLVTGIFSERIEPLRMGENAALILFDDERANLRTTLELNDAVKKRSLRISAINYEPYRGFSITLAKEGSIVDLGRPPFTSNLDRLMGVLTGLQRRQEVAERIELDYQGKAFIRLKKL